MRAIKGRLAVAATVVLGLAGLWRASLAVWHYRTSRAIVDDPSAKELEQVTALLELGLAILLIAHAGLAAFLIRHALRLHGAVILTIAAVTGVLVAGSFQQVPVLGATGLLPTVLTVGGAGAGYYYDDAWVSAYLGAAIGSVAGFFVAAPSMEWIVVLAVAIPAVLSAIVGVMVGRIIRRAGQSQRTT